MLEIALNGYSQNIWREIFVAAEVKHILLQLPYFPVKVFWKSVQMYVFLIARKSTVPKQNHVIIIFTVNPCLSIFFNPPETTDTIPVTSLDPEEGSGDIWNLSGFMQQAQK